MLELLIAYLPEGLRLATFWGVLAASFVGSFITIAFGIGGGGLLLAVLASLLPPTALIPVHGIVQLGSNLTRAGILFQRIAWSALPWFAVGTLVGSIAGGLVVVELPAHTVQAGIGVFIIYTVVTRPPAWLKRWPWLTGGISSFLTMFFGATGLFVAGYTKSLKLERHAHVATHASLMTIQHALKVVVFGLLGFAFSEWWLVIVAMVLAGVVGTYAGRLVLTRMSDVHFKRALDAILVLLSLRLIWQGIAGD